MKPLFDYEAARPALVAAGVRSDEVDHMMELASEFSLDMAEAMDAVVARKLEERRCVHPESMCVALAILTEMFLAIRIGQAGDRMLDSVACIEAVRKIPKVAESRAASKVAPDEGEDEDEESKTPMIH